MTDVKTTKTRRDFLKIATFAGGAALATAKGRPLYAQNLAVTGGTFDYIVAGGGHNGLVCAAYLAKAGFDVAVLEAKDIIGGNTTSEHMTGTTMIHEPCCNTPGGLSGSPVYRELALDEWGVQFANLSTLDGMVRLSQFFDGEILPMWLDPERTADEIARFSRRDSQTYLKLMQDLRTGPDVGSYRQTPIGYGPTPQEICAKHPKGATWMRLTRARCVDVVKEYYEDEHVRAWVLDYARGRQPVDDVGTGLDVGDMYGRQRRGNNTVIGGLGALPASLERLLASHSCPVIAKKFVIELIVEKGRIAGVVAADGDVFRARRGVVSSAHVQQLLTMAPAGSLPEMFSDNLKQWQPDILSMFSIMLDVREPPLFNVHGDWRPGCGNTINTFESQLRTLADCRLGVVTRGGVGSKCIVQSLEDPTRCPEGGHTVRILTHYPYNLADGGAANWDKIKYDVANQILDDWRQFTKNLDEENIVARYVQSPLDIAGRNINNVGGSCHGGSNYLAQYGEMRPVFGWASHRMPIEGLYLTGAGSHPGGSCHGLPGRNAAWVILDDEGKSVPHVLTQLMQA
ncbi:MAG: NAD(P)/FAD-dependent oxidoreductase [Gammaproteobacteria bacterium]